MASSHILESAVDLKNLEKRKNSSEKGHRDLQRQFDIDVDFVKYPATPESWRVR